MVVVIYIETAHPRIITLGNFFFGENSRNRYREIENVPANIVPCLNQVLQDFRIFRTLRILTRESMYNDENILGDHLKMCMQRLTVQKIKWRPSAVNLEQMDAVIELPKYGRGCCVL